MVTVRRKVKGQLSNGEGYGEGGDWWVVRVI